MITLYHGSGAQDCQILEYHLSGTQWDKAKNGAIRLLEARRLQESADTLKSLPFELSEGTNGFGDEFLVLHANVSIDEYAKHSEEMTDPAKPAVYRAIALTFNELGFNTRFIALLPDADAAVAVVAPPIPQTTTATVERALRDAQTLLATSGAASAVDRVHTAIHGYLKAICDEAAIPYGNDPNVSELFKLVRDRHPQFQANGPHDPDIVHILRASSKIIDSVNTLRNRASVAHPNPVLLEEPEAILVVNAVRTLLHYLDSKLRQ